MNSNYPAPTLRLVCRETSVSQPASVEEVSSTIGSGRPCHRWNALNNFAQLSLTALQLLVLALQFSLGDLRPPEIEIVINREREHTTDQAQKANVVTVVDSSRRSGHPQRAETAMRRGEGDKNERADIKPLSSNSQLEACRYPFIGPPVRNVERFLRRVRLPRWSLFDRHIRISRHQTLLSPDYGPFDFRGVLFVDNDVEL